MLICIAGESGVGKTTIAEIIEAFYGKENVVKLSTDDLHRWERKNKNWQHYTHLDPEANELDLGDFHINSLINNNSITRKKYNHKNGEFDKEIIIYPNKYIINEGLHGYYSDYLNKNADVKIFISVEENLKNHWKIIRDTESRGYTKEQSLYSIELRKKDLHKINERQSNNCDIKISLSTLTEIKNIGDKKEKIEISININNYDCKNKNLINFLIDYHESILSYINAIKILKEYNLLSGKGGNISVKIPNSTLMVIKKSGFCMSDTSYGNGYNIVNNNYLFNKQINNSSDLDCVLKKTVVIGDGHPSMEMMMHSIIPYTNVVHTHPKYLLSILCFSVAEEIINELYCDFNYCFIEYKTPGLELANEILNKIKDDKISIFFLQNHGLIVASNNIADACQETWKIEKIARSYIYNQINNKKYFPDAAILNDDETQDMNLFIYLISKFILGSAESLTKKQILELKNLDAEKRRQ